jgi:hypothetical protein
VPLAADFFGEDLSQVAYWRPSTGAWTVYVQSDGTPQELGLGVCGLSTDTPLP